MALLTSFVQFQGLEETKLGWLCISQRLCWQIVNKQIWQCFLNRGTGTMVISEWIYYVNSWHLCYRLDKFEILRTKETRRNRKGRKQSLFRNPRSSVMLQIEPKALGSALPLTSDDLPFLSLVHVLNTRVPNLLGSLWLKIKYIKSFY